MENLLKSLGQLIDQTTPVDPSSETGHWRSAYVYHGSADATWPLLTSLDRLGGVTPAHTKAHLEAHILRHSCAMRGHTFRVPLTNGSSS
jgi:hypothetical protein